jgi:hypothetical protein
LKRLQQARQRNIINEEGNDKEMFEEEKKTYTKDMKKRLENYRYSLFYKTITTFIINLSILPFEIWLLNLNTDYLSVACFIQTLILLIEL